MLMPKFQSKGFAVRFDKTLLSCIVDDFPPHEISFLTELCPISTLEN